MAVPRTATEVRETARVLGYRGYQVYTHVVSELARVGQEPSYSMIRDALGFNDKAEVCRVVQKLEKRGLLKREGSGRSHRIRLVVNNLR